MRDNTAARLLNDPEVKALLDEMRQDIKNDWARTPVTNTEAMVALRMQLNAIDGFASQLATRAHDYERKKQQE